MPIIKSDDISNDPAINTRLKTNVKKMRYFKDLTPPKQIISYLVMTDYLT